MSETMNIYSNHLHPRFGIGQKALGIKRCKNVLIKISNVARRCFVNFAKFVVWSPIILNDYIHGSKIAWKKLHPISFDKINHQTIYSNENSFILTKNAKESLEWKIDLIKNASQSIMLSGCYCGGKVFQDVLQILENKLETNANIQIHLLMNHDLLTKENKKKMEELGKKYPHQFHHLITRTAWTLSPYLRRVDNHVKILSIDNNTFVTGGTGIQNVLSNSETSPVSKLSGLERILGRGVSDMDLVCSGPLVTTVNEQFVLLWRKWSSIMNNKKAQSSAPILGKFNNLVKLEKFENHPDRVDKSKVQTYMETGSFEHGKENGCKRELIQQIRAAKKSIDIGSLVFNQKEIISELKLAAKRGVTIRVVTNGDYKDSPISARIFAPRSRKNYASLQKIAPDRVKIYEYHSGHFLYHKKITVIDEEVTLLGSFNYSDESAGNADEVIVIMKSKELAKQGKDILEEDMKKSQEISYHKKFRWNTIKALFFDFIFGRMLN